MIVISNSAPMTVIDLDARRKQRRQVLDTGLMRFGDMSISCAIRNVSKGGLAASSPLEKAARRSFHRLFLGGRKRAVAANRKGRTSYRARRRAGDAVH